MKSTKTRSVVVYVLSLMFVFGLTVFVSKIICNGSDWATKSINEHISVNGTLSTAGKVLDRNNKTLAQTKDGERIYSEDALVREAMLQTVGDNTKFISTSVQNVFKSDLIGYNLVTGIGTNRLVGIGNDIKLTLDSELCKQTYESFNGKHGAAVLYNYTTGEILCMVSSPSFDPNDPPNIASDDTGRYDGVYLNKCISSSFTPGSIFKIITCAAAIDNIEDIDTKRFYCNGSLKVGNDEITCLSKHGDIGFEEAMSVSCNIVFAEIAMDLGIDKMTDKANSMGFNRQFDIDGINISKSIYDAKNSSLADLGWSGIGQYTDLVNPIYMTMLMGAIANDGIAVKPYMIEQVTTPIGLPTKIGYGRAMQRMLKVDTANEIKDIMRYTVKNNYGDSLFPNLTVCAKTGTAEVGNDKEPHGWMVGFSKDRDCTLAFAVIVENSGYGISTAGPIAENMINTAAKNMKG